MSAKWEKSNRSAIGEPFVWLTSAGMIIGLLMVIVLLWVITKNGMAAFWPRKVVEITATVPDTEVQKWVGEIVMHQKRHPSTVLEGMAPGDTQLFVGNRDAHGFSFKFFNDAYFGEPSYPENILKIEREEYGFALCVPKSLKLADGTIIAGDSPEFPEALEVEEERVNRLRHDIHAIEKVAIGKINRALQDYREDLAGIEKELGEEALQSDPRALEIVEEMAVLQEEYHKLDEERLELHKGLGTGVLSYAITQGDDRTLTTGKIISHYFPNRLSLLGRCNRFVRNFWTFLSEDPREANTEGGIFPAIFGTFIMTILMSLAVTPFGVLAAIYLHEYARKGPFLTGVRIAVNNLAGVPSIVFGVFGLGFFVYIVGHQIDTLFYPNAEGPVFGTGGLLWASLTLALLTVPVVIVATEEALSSVPRGAREASLACGASKWQTIQRIILPASAPGILTGIILAMARGAGEVAPLMLVGVVKIAETLPLNTIYPYLHAEQKFMHLGFHIYDLGFQSPDSEAARPMVFATTFLLILLVVIMNLAGIIIRERLRRKYKSSTF